MGQKGKDGEALREEGAHPRYRRTGAEPPVQSARREIIDQPQCKLEAPPQTPRTPHPLRRGKSKTDLCRRHVNCRQWHWYKVSYTGLVLPI